MTLIIWQTPHFQNCVFERRHFFSPDRRSKVVKYAKNYPLDAMIVLAKHETFLFFPWNWFKVGTIGWFFSFLAEILIFWSFFTYSSRLFFRLGLFSLIQSLYLYTQTYFGPIHVLSQPFNILFRPTFLLLLFVLLSLLLMLMLLLSSVPVGKFSTSWIEASSVINVSPIHLTSHPQPNPGRYFSRPSGKLKFSIEALFN